MNLQEYEALREKGRPAEALAHGVLRGGFVVDGVFYAHGGGNGIVRAPISEVTDLKFHDEREAA